MKDFKFNDKVEELWILKNPTNSFLKIKIFMYIDLNLPNSKLELSKIHSATTHYDTDDTASPYSKLNNANIELYFNDWKLSQS